MPRPLHRLVVIAALLFVPQAADALTIFNYSATTNERFSSGFPSSPVANSSFFLAGYNLSGIGWSSGNFGMTLISPQHFLTAAHVAPVAGTTISFLSTGGVVRTYTVSSTFTLQQSAGVSTDLVVGRLTAAISPADQVTYYPTLLLDSFAAYDDVTVAAFGSGQRAGINTIDAAGIADMLPFGSPNGIPDNAVFVTDYDSLTGQTQGQVGDSGSPSFVGVGGSLALVGTHSATNSTQTFDVLIPYYYSDINARLALDGYTFGAYVVSSVPEPETWGILSGLVVLGVARFRRRAS